MGPTEQLHEIVRNSAAALAGGNGTSFADQVKLERPPRAELGDYSTNAALLLAPRLKRSPRDVAGLLGDALTERLGAALARTDVAGPGFLNLFVADEWLTGGLREILAAGDSYGAADAPVRTQVNIEFVSANPTGPVHIGHARGAAYGAAWT
jgi:arginyl-tRNA synthetase